MPVWRCASQAIAYHPVLSEEGAAFLPDDRVRVRLKMPPTAQEVELRMFSGARFPLARQADGCWEATLELPEGYQYLRLMVDGADMLSPFLPIGFGGSRPINAIDAPAKDEAFYQALDVAHGTVSHHFFPSQVTGHTESCLVYLPPAYDAQTDYPVLYLQHGHGENELAWFYQGRMNFILDNLIASGDSVPMMVVMGNGMVRLGHGYDCAAYPEMLIRDIIPYVEQACHVSGDKWRRAVAGLSMGSMHASAAALAHPDMFGYVGLFSGFLRNLFTKEQPHLELLDHPDVFSASFRVFFRAMGREDEFFDEFIADDALLERKGVKGVVRREYVGTHEWQVWRRCLRDFITMIFKE